MASHCRSASPRPSPTCAQPLIVSIASVLSTSVRQTGLGAQVLNTNEPRPQVGIRLGQSLSKYELKQCENHADALDRHPWQGLMGLKQMNARELEEHRLRAPQHTPLTLQQLQAIPASFDARTQWPSCGWLNAPKDQGQCGRCLSPHRRARPLLSGRAVARPSAAPCLCSCWAFAAALAMSIRLCTTSNGAYNVDISPQDLTSCTTTGGCSGWYPDCALWYSSPHCPFGPELAASLGLLCATSRFVCPHCYCWFWVL